MLKVFQELFVDPVDDSPLTFEGETKEGAWYQGQLRSPRGEAWPVEDGIPCFVRESIRGWKQEQIDQYLTEGIYDWNWRNGNGAPLASDSEQALACQEAASRGFPILDIASGPGGGLMPGIYARNPQASVLITDVGAPVLHGWQRYLKSQGIAVPISYVCLDAQKMPLASESVKVMTSLAGFSELDHPEDAIREAARVLASDGMIYADETSFESEGLIALCAAMGWDFESRFHRNFPEMFEACGLQIMSQAPSFRRKLRPDDNEWARIACEKGIDIWIYGSLFRVVKG